jgi:hypothetical protein
MVATGLMVVSFRTLPGIACSSLRRSGTSADATTADLRRPG